MSETSKYHLPPPPTGRIPPLKVVPLPGRRFADSALPTATMTPVGRVEVVELRRRQEPPTTTQQPLIPTASEIEKLPRWAAVALAARCASRVQPLLGSSWPPIPEPLLNTSAESIPYVIRHCVEGGNQPAVKDMAFQPSPSTAYNAVAASVASVAAAETARFVTMAVQAAAAAITQSAALASHLTGHVSRIRRDYELLARLAATNHWTDETPVPPDILGPLWAPGHAPDWAEESSGVGNSQSVSN